MRTSVYRWFERHVWAGDAILGGLVFVVLVINASDYRYGGYKTVLLLIVSAAPLFVRRSLPQLALIGSIILLLANLDVFDSPTFAVVLAPVMVHAAVVHAGSRAWGRTALAVGLLGSVLAPLRWGYTGGEPLTYLTPAGLCAVSVIAAFVIGERQRDRVENQAQQLRAMAERSSLLASEREQRALIAASTERTRIARELHDIVAHSLSVIIVQADGAAVAVAARPELAADVLHTIAETSRDALGEMRRLVGVLRTSDSDGFAPAPGVADVPALVEQVRHTGVRVELRIDGAAAPLPAGLDLTVYRLVQEALTNVIKHAGPGAAAVVEIGFVRGQLLVGVTDDGRGAAADPSPDGGHGLLGMRERVALQGGGLAVGPQVGGGFAVRARFPLHFGARR